MDARLFCTKLHHRLDYIRVQAPRIRQLSFGTLEAFLDHITTRMTTVKRFEAEGRPNDSPREGDSDV